MTWVSKQPWYNGKVALTANSWLAISQWKISALCPEGLAALTPWEGFSNMYRHNLCEGGIPFWGLHDLSSEVLVGQGRFEDASALLKDKKNKLWNAY